jgi:hypothetical protein
MLGCPQFLILQTMKVSVRKSLPGTAPIIWLLTGVQPLIFVHLSRTSRYTLSLKPADDTDPGAPERDRMRSVWTRDVVAKEDQALCESVQRGMSRRNFHQGWYVSDLNDHGISEHAMRHFTTSTKRGLQKHRKELVSPNPPLAELCMDGCFADKAAVPYARSKSYFA